MPDEMMSKLIKGIKEFGLVEPLVINGDNTLIGGHQRLQAAVAVGLKNVPCVRVDLDKKKEKALNLALNKIQGEWDNEKLSVLLKELDGDRDFDLDFTGFGTFEVANLVDFNDDLSDLINADRETDVTGATSENGGASSIKGGHPYYTIIFDHENDRDEWHDYIHKLNVLYPDIETAAGKIMADIRGRHG